MFEVNTVESDQQFFARQALVGINALREAGLNDPSGEAGKAYLELLDLVDLAPLRASVDNVEAVDVALPRAWSPCAQYIQKRALDLSFVFFTDWIGRPRPIEDWRGGSARRHLIILSENLPLLKLVSLEDAMPTWPPDKPLTAQEFTEVGGRFNGHRRITDEQQANSNGLLAKGDIVAGVIIDDRPVDVLISIISAPTYSRCLLP